MKKTLFITFVAFFIATNMLALLGVTKVIPIEDHHLTLILSSGIIAILSALIALFRKLFALPQTHSATQEDPTGKKNSNPTENPTETAVSRFTENDLGVVYIGSRLGRNEAFQAIRDSARQQIFVVGIGMSQIAHDSESLLRQARQVPIDIFLPDPEFLSANPYFTNEFGRFLDDMPDFHSRLTASISKFSEVCMSHNSLPNAKTKMSLRLYRTLPCLSMVAIDPDTPSARLIVEFFYYRAGTHRPRLHIEAGTHPENLYRLLYSRYRELWNHSKVVV